MEKITCVVDACSFIYMQIPTYTSNTDKNPNCQEYTLFDLFIQSDAVTIKITQEVIDEIKDPKKKSITRYNEMYANIFHSGKHKFGRHFLDKMHSGFFDENLWVHDSLTGNLVKENLGEKVNFSAILEMFFGGKRNLVFLSDDTKAQKKSDILSNLTGVFNMCLYWDTFDAISFLYLIGYKRAKPILSTTQVEQTINELFSYFVRKSEEYEKFKYDREIEIINQTEYENHNKKNKDLEKLDRIRKQNFENSINTFNLKKASELKKFNQLKKIFM